MGPTTEPHIAPADLETWAGYLLDHSLGGIVPEDRVMIKGERACWPLMAVLERRVIEAGAVPDVFLVPPNNDRGRVWSAAMGEHGTPAQMGRAPRWFRDRYESMTKYVEVLGAEDPSAFSGLSAAQNQALAMADRTYGDLRLAKPWVITLYPTPGLAAVEGLPLDEYAEFLVRASTQDPRPLRDAEERLRPLFDRGRTLTIDSVHPEGERPLRLEMGITHGRARLSYGLRNFPDGEVFTSPDADSVRGEVFVDLPVYYDGHDIAGIYLRFEDGVIVEYAAATGHEHLAAIVETDAGSHRLGEVAFGMNPGLDRVLKHPLFVEKVGGTMHIAIGASYEDCYVDDPDSVEDRSTLERLEGLGVLNRSARHVDIVIDFRPGGAGRAVHIDGQPVTIVDGVWAPASERRPDGGESRT